MLSSVCTKCLEQKKSAQRAEEGEKKKDRNSEQEKEKEKTKKKKKNGAPTQEPKTHKGNGTKRRAEK
jgi:hypothetical protein